MTAVTDILIEADGYRIARDTVPMVAHLQAAVAVCVYDDTQGVGGLLHLRYLAKGQTKPLDLTDNTLSSDLLLLDRFCKELRTQGARKHSWRVRLIGHIPHADGIDQPAATLLDLLRAYFADGRLPVECKELRREQPVAVRLQPRDGQLSLADTAPRTP
jgi:chemotaxis receptor (MCP) glutamine deamidase CheD